MACVDPLPGFYTPCSNVEIIRRVIRNLISAYENLGSTEKVEELKELQEILSSPDLGTENVLLSSTYRLSRQETVLDQYRFFTEPNELWAGTGLTADPWSANQPCSTEGVKRSL